MFIRASPGTADLWQGVADRVATEGWRDQAKINEALDASKRRQAASPDSVWRFESPSGLKVRVLRPDYFWGMHMGWLVPPETTLLHMTCCDPPLKKLIAAQHGFTRDVDGYYSSPPAMLSWSGSLAGSQLDIAQHFRMLAALAIATARALVLPMYGHLSAEPAFGDGRVGIVPEHNSARRCDSMGRSKS